MSDPREEKLPRWARDRMGVLRMRAAEAEQSLRVHLAAAGSEGSPVWYGDYERRFHLPMERGRFMVNFDMDGQGDSYGGIQVIARRGNPELEIMGGHSMTLRCGASNVLYVALEDSHRRRR